MRAGFFISLGLTLILAGAFWYQSTAYICPVPLSYRIGTLDPAFALASTAAQAQISAAEAVWEAAVDRELFVYDPAAEFTIDFIYDERQATTDTEASARASLDAKQRETERVQSTIAEVQAEYDALADRFGTRRSEYEAALTAYNERVQRYNDQGGAPPPIFAELEAERARLDSEAVALERLAADLNTLAERLNELAQEGNALVEEYNTAVEAYNAAYGYAREFTQGDYQGDAIHIYQFSSELELQRVLAHEFGHALGIGHVAGSSSLMYYLLGDTSATPTLSSEDRLAYYEVCGTGPSFGQQVRRVVRTTLKW